MPRRDKSPPGPTKQQLRGLQYNADAAKPAFLRNAIAALSGTSQSNNNASVRDGRVPIPSRPDNDQDHMGAGDDSDQDEWDLGRGEEAPAVVVLKEGKHLDKTEVDQLRQQAKANNERDPLQAQDEAAKERRKGTLNFASGGTGGSGNNKRQRVPVGQDYDDDGEEAGHEDGGTKNGLNDKRPSTKRKTEETNDDESAWQSVISASNLDAKNKKLAQEKQQQAQATKAKQQAKQVKQKKKLDKKKIGMLSFDDE
ncbi:hypothetical protein OIO90_002671 [Microbotryomycetes sp. JL221]|nr:hypothetical protein OIO90_002671 [Microbotryomycetes sp. JL221]